MVSVVCQVLEGRVVLDVMVSIVCQVLAVTFMVVSGVRHSRFKIITSSEKWSVLCVRCLMQCSWLSQVFDVMIHRLLEQPPVQKMLDAILEHIGCLYKFHGESSVIATGQVANSPQVLLSSCF